MTRPLDPPRRLLCLWLPNWPIQRLRRTLAGDAPEDGAHQPQRSDSARSLSPAAPESAGEKAEGEGLALRRSLVLWGTDPRRGRLVVACCHRASRCGVRPGMTIGQANSLLHCGEEPPGPSPKALSRPAIAAGLTAEKTGNSRPEASAYGSESCSALIFQHDSQADLEALRELAEACACELSPIVAIEPLDDFLWAGQVLHQPQALLMDVTGVGDLFGSEQQLAAAALKLLGRHRLEGRVAIADTAGAAWGVAHYGAADLFAPDHFVGDPDSPEACPGACIVPPRETSAAISRLPVVALRIASETAVMLRRLGVERIDALMRLPRSGLATRLGADLLRRLDQALGDVEEPLPAHHAVAADRASVDLEYPTRDADILRHQLEGLVGRVARQLSERQRGALRLICRFDVEQPPPLEIRIGLFTPSATAGHLMRLLAGHLEKCRFRFPAHRIVVAATLTGPLATHQPAFDGFGDDTCGSTADLSRLIDGLSSRLGRNRVLAVEPTDDPLPEQAVRLRPLTGQPIGAIVPGRPAPRVSRGRQRCGKTSSARSTRAPSPTAGRAHASWETPPATTDPLRRPLMMLSKPIALTVLQPTAEQGRGQAEADAPPEQFRCRGRVHRTVRSWGPERLETGWWNGPMHRRDYYRIETEEGVWMWIYHDLRQHRWWLHGHFF